jgi:putative endonuclease
MFYVYVLYSEAYHKTYIGYTSNLQGRLEAHNHPSNKGYTKRFQPWKIVYSEEFSSQSEALAREKFLKTGAGRNFLKQFIPSY